MKNLAKDTSKPGETSQQIYYKVTVYTDNIYTITVIYKNATSKFHSASTRYVEATFQSLALDLARKPLNKSMKTEIIRIL